MPRGSVYRLEIVNARAQVPGAEKKALTASARTYESGSMAAQSLRKTGSRTRSSAWQNELWDMYDQVPEFRGGCEWVGNLLSKAILYIAKDGKQTTDPKALDALASLFGGEEGQEEMLRLLGINFTAAGEAFIAGIPTKGDDDWKVVAATEVSGETTGRITIEGDPVPDGTLVIRLWRAHPRKSIESDCPARSLLPTLSEIVRLNQVVASQADSRLKGNGLLILPSELEMPAIPMLDEDGELDTTALQDTTNISEGVTQRLIMAAKIAMANRDSAAASIPLVLAAPGEFIEKVQWIDFFTGFDEYSQKLREEARKSIGVGMGMPLEQLSGTGGANHWSSWQMEEATIKVHMEPLLAVIMSSLTQGYLHPILKDWGVEDYESYTVEANTAALRLRPNRSKEAFELWDRGALSARTLLEENGFDPNTDLPDEKEKMVFFLTQIARKTAATPDQLSTALSMLGLKGMPSGVPDQTKGALETPSLQKHPVRAIPEQTQDAAPDEQVVTASAAFVVDGLLLACEAHVGRALERAGNKLKRVVGRETGTPAYELYMLAPRMDRAECEQLLEDAWGPLDRFGYGADTDSLRDALNTYTLDLLRMRRPYSRADLAEALRQRATELVAA